MDKGIQTKWNQEISRNHYLIYDKIDQHRLEHTSNRSDEGHFIVIKENNLYQENIIILNIFKQNIDVPNFIKQN